MCENGINISINFKEIEKKIDDLSKNIFKIAKEKKKELVNKRGYSDKAAKAEIMEVIKSFTPDKIWPYDISKSQYLHLVNNLVGFDGIKSFSEDKKYCVTKSDGGCLALVKKKEIVYKTKEDLPTGSSIDVSNSGSLAFSAIVKLEDNEVPHLFYNKLFVYDSEKNLIFSSGFQQIISEVSIRCDPNIVVFCGTGFVYSENNDAEDENNYIYIIDINKNELISKFKYNKYIWGITINKESITIEGNNYKYFYKLNGTLLNKIKKEKTKNISQLTNEIIDKLLKI